MWRGAERDPATGATPILTYHSIDPSGSVISIAPDAFGRQLRRLREAGFQGISLGELLDVWEGKQMTSGRPVVLTFDDGFDSVAELAAPLLRELGFRATIFAVAGYCGRTNDWPSQPRGIPRLRLLSMPQLRDLAKDGLEIGAHGLGHAPLDALTPQQAEREVVESKLLLEDGLGRPVSVFAYPYGRAGRATRDLVRSRYRAACSAMLQTARVNDDRHWLGRIDMYYFREPWAFRLFGTPPGRAYLGLRALGRSIQRRLP